MTGQQQDLMDAIIADPFDDTPRLIYADWCEENDDPDRALFIRAQIAGNEAEALRLWQESRVNGGPHPWVPVPEGNRVKSNWLSDFGRERISFPRHVTNHLYIPSRRMVQIILRRGFVDEILCHARDWFGESCRNCYDGRFTHDCSHRYIVTDDEQECAYCRGRIETKGLAAPVLKVWPLTEVSLVDRFPEEVPGGAGRSKKRQQVRSWRWRVPGLSNFASEPIGCNFTTASVLPAVLDNLFAITYDSHRLHPGYSRSFDSQVDAVNAYSPAILDYGRVKANLPQPKRLHEMLKKSRETS